MHYGPALASAFGTFWSALELNGDVHGALSVGEPIFRPPPAAAVRTAG